MSKTKTAKPAKKAKETPEAVEQPEVPEITDQELQARNEKVTFVANNILNSITLNQAVTVIQQVALRDANTIVEEADEEKLKENSHSRVQKRVHSLSVEFCFGKFRRGIQFFRQIPLLL